jgi:metal-sulfur cluster biosynthetic enzyme
MSAERGTFHETPSVAGERAAADDSPSLFEPKERPAEERNGMEEKILDVLRNVLDPELGINIVDLGLVYHVSVEGEKVRIEYTLTTMGCPIGPLIEEQMKQFLDGVPGVSEVDAEMVLTPPWTPDKMSEEAKAALGMI